MKQISRKWLVIIIFCTFWTLLGLSFAYISYSVADSENRAIFPIVIFGLNLIKFYLWFAFAPLIFLIVKHFGFENRETFLRNFFIQIGFGILLIVLHTAVYTPLVALIDPQIKKALPSISTLFEKYLFFGNLYLNILLYALLVIIAQGYLFFDHYLAEKTRSSRLKVELAAAQLQALKMQLQPHFLFNTLHSISSLNLSNPMKANAMIARLGDFLRMTLDRSDEQTVTLNEELEFLRCYLEIEQIRFSDRLTVEFDIADETLSAQVPHLILQPIVENALKHGIAPYAAKGKIDVSAHKANGRLLLQIRDNGAKTNKIAVVNGNGKGLSNVRSRLEQLYEKNFRLTLNETETGMEVDLEIPLAIEN